MKEEWKIIEDTFGKYSVSNLGNVRINEHYTEITPSKVNPLGKAKLYKEAPVKQYLNCSGYKIVYLQVAKGKRIIRPVHRLVAQAFIPNPNNLPFVNHKDETRCNNCVDNLEWCDPKYNANYGTRNKLLSISGGRKVAQYTLDGKFVKIWDSVMSISRYYGVKSTTCISRVCRHAKGRLSYKGYKWEYVECQKYDLGKLTKEQLVELRDQIDNKLKEYEVR